MPSVETFDCVDDAVLWESSGTDNYGVVKVLEPVAIKCRWNDDARDGQDSQGTKVSLIVRISALRSIPMDSILWHGLLADLPANPTDLCQVKADTGGIDVKGRAMRYEYGLARFMDKLPIFAPGTGS